MLTAGRNTQQRDGDTVSLQMAGAIKIWGGGIVMINAAGYAVNGQTAANLTYAGRAEGTVNNLAGANGAKSITVKRHKVFKWLNSAADPITIADLFKIAYVVDDETVAKTNGGNTRSAAGKIIGIDADGIWIE